MTVSRVLNNKEGVSEKTRAHVLETVRSLGYNPTPNLTVYSSRSTLRFVGLIVPNVTTAYILEVVRGVSNAAERLHYGLILYLQGQDDHIERSAYYSALLSSGAVDGVLMLASLDYDILTPRFRQSQVPYVLVDDHFSESGTEPRVLASNYRGMLDAVRHVLALGHRRIGFITGRMEAECSVDRLQGYKDGLREVGLEYDPDLVRQGDFTREAGYREVRELFDVPERPTAILASNDEMAFGVMDAVHESGLRIGRDISLVGFDDLPMALTVTPPLTTVRQPLVAMGEAALEMLIGLIEGKKPGSLRRELPTELIVRGSTGRAPNF